jgi:hypothetical protein
MIEPSEIFFAFVEFDELKAIRSIYCFITCRIGERRKICCWWREIHYDVFDK